MPPDERSASASSGETAVRKQLKRLYERAKSVNSAYSLFDRLLYLVLLVSASVSSLLAWATTWWHWYWVTLSWAGVAFAFLIAWITLSVGVYLVRLSARNFREAFGSWLSK